MRGRSLERRRWHLAMRGALSYPDSQRSGKLGAHSARAGHLVAHSGGPVVASVRVRALFQDRLQIVLALTIGGEPHSLQAGSIEDFRVELSTWGFEVEVGFRVNSELEDDPIFPGFSSMDPIEAKLSIARYLGPDEKPTPLELSGYVVEKWVEETVAKDLEKRPIVGRRYRIRMLDPAAALWRQHFPLELRADTSMKKVIEAQTSSGIQVEFDWDRLDEEEDIICLGLTADRPASFYDLLVSYIAKHEGVLELDPATNTYRIAGEKKRSGNAGPIDIEVVKDLRIRFPEPGRHTTHVLNPHTEAAIRNTAVENPHSRLGIRHDVFAHTPLSSRFDARVAVEKKRLRPSEHRIELELRRFPNPAPTTTRFLSLGERFSNHRYPHGHKFRLIELRILGHAQSDEEADIADEVGPFELEMSASLELVSEPKPNLPDFNAPTYPIFVEGKLLSSSGEEDERTWSFVENERDSIHYHRVHIPLWDVTIIAPFSPNLLNGQFFFPGYKDQRVLVALDFDRAEIHRFLDWAANARLPSEAQGNQIVMGFKDGNGTVIQHYYRDDKPLLRVERKLGADIETIDVMEGTIRIEVKEESDSK